MSALRSAFKRDAAIFPGALAVPVPGSFRSSSAGTDVTDSTALSLMTFFAGVRIIADSITFLPLRAVMILPDGTRSPLPASPCQIVSPFAVLLLTAAVFGLFGFWWALLPAAVYLVFVSFTMGGTE